MPVCLTFAPLVQSVAASALPCGTSYSDHGAVVKLHIRGTVTYVCQSHPHGVRRPMPYGASIMLPTGTTYIRQRCSDEVCGVAHHEAIDAELAAQHVGHQPAVGGAGHAVDADVG